MDSEQKRLLYRNMLLIGILIFIIISVIFVIYYEPFELIGDSDIDEMLIRMNRENIALFIFVDFAFSFVGSIFIIIVFQEIAIKYAPIKEAKASLKKKELIYIAHPSLYSSRPASAVYKLTFELESGVEKVFPVDPILYAAYFEGNKGILKYKEYVYRRLVDFYVEEVS